MTRLPALMALLTACATLACGARVSTPTTLRPASAQGIVYVSTGARIDIVEVPGGQVLGEMPLGTPSPDWRWIYTAGHGRLEQVDTATGRLAASLPAPDWAQSVRTSANGAWLALIGSSTGPPSRFEVMDAAFARQPVLVGLNGVFTFDGLSNDGRRLYLLQWVRAGSYQVRMYDLVAGILNPQVIADKREIGQLMSGEALTSLTTTDGASQLTLYQRSAKNEAFVHELPIGVVQDVPFAYCQDLPSPASGWAFVQRPQRGLFYAANPQAGWVIELS